MIKKLFFILINFLFVPLASFSVENNYFTSTGNFQSHRNSELTNINLNNINKLEVVWKYKNKLETKDDPTAANALTPIIIGDAIIFGTLDNYLISLDAKNGKVKWKKKYQGFKNIAKRGLTFKSLNLGKKIKKVIFLPTNKTILAVDSDTGDILTELGNEGKFGTNGTGLPPIIFKNDIFISSGSKIENYKILEYEKNWSINLNGARVWSGFSYDEVTNSLIVVTSDPADLIYSKTGNPDYFNSIIIIDASTGKIKCSFQDVKHDHWDLDMVGHPIVVNNLLINGETKNLVFGFSKTGNILAVNLDKCEFEFKNSFKDVAVSTHDNSIKNANYAKTQKKFLIPEPISSIKYELDQYLKTLEDKDNREFISHKLRYSKFNENYIPLSLNYDSTLIGLHGGPQWTGGSFDKINNQIVVSTNHDPWIIRVFYQDQIYRVVRGVKIRLKRFIDKYDFLSSYKKKELLDKDLNSRIKRYVQSEDFLEEYKILKGTFKLVDNLYFNTTRLFHFSGSKIYKNKCLSCHGHYRQSYFETEFTGDDYVPSLTNLSKLDRFKSMESLENFNFNHKYVDDKIDISEDQLYQIKNYFEKIDKVLNKLNLIHTAYKWQVILDKNNLPASKQPWGKVSAINIVNGKINWSIPSGTTTTENNIIKGSTNFGGLLSTKSNILFSTGTSDEKIYAYDLRDGSQVWSHKLPFSGSAAPMTFLIDGEQYLLVNASGGRYFNYKKTNSEYLVVFKLLD